MIKSLTSLHINHFSQSLYSAQQTRDIDKLAIEQLYQGNGYALMKKAGYALFQFASSLYPEKCHWLIFCGRGNNGGDGYVAATLAKAHDIDVTVVQIGETETLSETLQGEALHAFKDLNKHKNTRIISFESFKSSSITTDDGSYLIIDSMLGTGLAGEVRGEYQKAIAWINQSNHPTIAVDIPSGLSADTGRPLGTAVQADHTITFIGINKGLVTGQAKNYTGTLSYDELGIGSDIKSQVDSLMCLLSSESIKLNLFKRRAADHKGNSGRALFIGGSDGTSGAALLACEASLKSGIGLLSALVGNNAVTPMLSRSPEVMVRGFEKDIEKQLPDLLEPANAVAIGPGLSTAGHAKRLLTDVLKTGKPTIIDADGLNLIAMHPEIWQQHGHGKCILTPHPAEAARLLECSVEEIESDRYLSITKLVDQFQCTVLLKGSGTLISNNSNNIYICYLGNEAMASGGMGDVLSGLILSFLAKSQDCIESTKYAAFIHAMAGESASQQGIIGCLPTDVISASKLIINETLEKIAT
ncbi:NAD(P)H-hydrate dehydratase [Litoribrevibacter euphylliae]|uniref:Bifunctional NAD(P)H-hydrate repair enzyme n=1 Tax=Litoribrevibacter euphylliae TaxID=1834034 RepID=A0ABV7HD46_9GAMM